ncbi:MAG TPA: histidine kinase [Solirubrobacteraceae bacterium]|jgi:signal transduction histidine kinase|nr:histidine kinase [Solirubrobacteraceae bacterium]
MGGRPVKAFDFDVRTRGPAESRSRPSAAAAVVVGVVTGGLIALELLRSVHSVDAGVRAAVETVIAAVTLVSIRVLCETFDRGHQLRGLLLILGIVVLSLGDFSYWVGSVVAGASMASPGGAARLACELIGAFALVGAAFVPSDVIVRPPRGQASVAAALGVAAILGAVVLAEILTSSVPATWTVGSVGVGVGLLSTAALIVAALAFVARPSRMERGTELLAGACLLLAAGGVQFVTMPVVPADWVTPRDGARVLAFALFLGGAYLRYRQVQRHRAYTAICSERERAARDLHDGLAQDLACISTAAQRLDCNLEPEHPLMLATRDALAEVRGMITDLTASTAATSEEAVRMVARDVGRRLDLDVDVRADAVGAPLADSGLELGSRDALIRATRQAITNAGQGQARQVDVALGRRAGHVVVRVSGDAGRVTEGPAGEATRERRARGVSRLSAEWSRRSRRLRPI